MLTLSIVIPTYNEAVALPVLLKSISTQTLQPMEVIVADAKSTDRTREIAREFGAVVTDGGMPGSGRNLGAKIATGDYILFLDADVVLESPDFLERMLNETIARELDLGVPDVLPKSGKRLDIIFHKLYNWYVRKLERIHPHAPGFCMLAKRSAHEAINGFDESVKFCEDHDYSLRIKKAGLKFGVLSLGIPVSTRRFQRDGYVNVAVKYLLAEIYIWLLGPIRNNLFNYTFGHSGNKKK